MKTREVKIGKIGVGKENPVRIQSMTTSSTRDVEETVNQIICLADRGCEIIRITVQGMKEVESAEKIKNALIQKGYDVPLVADIHFYPPAALHVVDFVEKVRINPGNFVDRRATFRSIEYDDATYALEVDKIEEKFAPLVEKCLKLKRAMRIGANHGSLSDRIMNRYGDTPFGMIESAFEFARIARKMGYHDLIFSMKASNPLVMVSAYRLLVEEMTKLGWDYPLHLGVTEAGEGEDGRIKSALGIGTLLLEGIGDTIRVSLTEDPWEEIEPCKQLIPCKAAKRPALMPPKRTVQPSSFLHRDGTILLTITQEEIESPSLFEDLGCTVHFGRPYKENTSVDGLIYAEKDLPLQLQQLQEAGIPIYHPDALPFIRYQLTDLDSARQFFEGQNDPVILSIDYTCRMLAAAKIGSLLLDNLGEGIHLHSNEPLNQRRTFSFNLLQAARMRTTKTEFISCPGCGRTLFNLQEVSRRIREKTGHLPGVKIAIMGCIVNGPGEMADADFGYVGSKPGKIDLYVGKTCVEKNVDFADADEMLIALIKSHNRWVEPSLLPT